MQVGKVNWAGQTFALARCSDSQGKRTSSRRTKEERRKMVESFIKGYRDSNNGKFPSLNLTHKEVGGSFYIVREIVREIIQENKVLRPGSLNSQAFNLDDYSEQHLPEPFSSDHLLHTIEHSSDERRREMFGCDVNQNTDEVLSPSFSTISDHDTTNFKEKIALHSHAILVSQVIDGDSYEEKHFQSWHDTVYSTNETSIEELIQLSGHGQNTLPTEDDNESCHNEIKGENFAKCETVDPVGFSQPLSTNSTIGVSEAKDIKSDMQVESAPISSNGLDLEVATSIDGRASGGPVVENSTSNSNAREKPNFDGTHSEPLEAKEAKEKMENTEANPFMAIIKGLVTAFIKFWTE